MTTEQTEDKGAIALRAEVAPVVARAGALVVATPEQYQDAAGFLKAIKAAQQKVTAHFGGMKAAAHAAWKAITAKESETLAPLADAERIVKARMVEWQQEQERIRLAEQRRLQAIADEAARKERERAEAAARVQREKEAEARAEQQRQERLAAQARTEAARQAAQAAAEEARKRAEAAAAKAEAKDEQAANVAPAPVVQVASVAPKVAGQSLRKTWRAEVTDAAAVPREWLVVNQTALDAFARATKGAVAVAGVKFVEDVGLSSRGA